jgi:transposase
MMLFLCFSVVFLVYTRNARIWHNCQLRLGVIMCSWTSAAQGFPMRHFTFTPEDLDAIRRDRYHHPHPRVQQKMEVLWLKSQAFTHADIASLADVSRHSVQRYLDEYADGGLERIRRLPWKGKPSELDVHRPSLEDYFLENPPRSAREAQAAIEGETGVRRGLSQVRAFMKKTLGLRWRKVGTIPAKANAQEQADFLKNKLQPRLRQAERGVRTVLFVDAAHFIYGPFLGFLWCVVRRFVPGPSGRKRYNVLAALNAVSHEVIRVANHSYINAASVCDLLRQIAAAGLPRPITLVLDNARYQRCELVQALARSLRIELLFLPSYSPNLNLIERLWKFVKKECLASRPMPNYETFTQTIDDCLKSLGTKYKGQMITLLALNFQTFEDEPFLAA